MKDIIYIKGDVTKPIGDDHKLIIHCCNDIGRMGSGVAKALFMMWSEVRRQYIQWHRSNNGFKLGKVQFVKVEDDIVVCNMIGQHKIKSMKGKLPPIRYGAMAKCLEMVMVAAKKNDASVHCPYKMGSDLAGGSWDKIEALIIEHLCEHDIQVTVYDIKGAR
jgi:O-acetyl-ADP-ribose deacetylase (regulator of RNase III)